MLILPKILHKGVFKHNYIVYVFRRLRLISGTIVLISGYVPAKGRRSKSTNLPLRGVH